MNSIRTYLGFFKLGYLESKEYTFQTSVTVMTNSILLIVSYYMWKSIYHFNALINGSSFNEMLRYVVIVFIINGAFTFTFESQVSKRIINGEIVFDLLKPVNYKIMLFCRLIGTSIIEYFGLIVLGLSIIKIYAIDYQITIFQFFLFLLSFLISIILKYDIVFMFSLFCFYVDNYIGIVKARELLTNFLSGAMIPFFLFPNSISRFLNISPFACIISVPANIFLGSYSYMSSIIHIAVQTFWSALFGLLLLWLWKKSVTKISVYGG